MIIIYLEMLFVGKFDENNIILEINVWIIFDNYKMMFLIDLMTIYMPTWAIWTN